MNVGRNTQAELSINNILSTPHAAVHDPGRDANSKPVSRSFHFVLSCVETADYGERVSSLTPEELALGQQRLELHRVLARNQWLVSQV